jgi:acetylornithine deacetylase/succinyl-diaminopimelate desuccinylase-like protein
MGPEETMPETPINVIEMLPRIRAASDEMREILVANIVMIGEIPAPTGAEESRARFFSQRLNEGGLLHCFTDPMSNAFGLLPGTDGRRTIAVVTNGDTLVYETTDQTVEVRTDMLVGPFVVDNSLALGALAALPELFDKLQIRLRSNLLLLMASRCQGRGNLDGLKHFLSEARVKPDAGICFEGVQLGRLNYSCLGMRRGEITCRLPDNYNWAQYGNTGAIVPMSDVISRIGRIAIPRRPLTSMILGSIEGGVSYHNIARQAVLRFELRSESAEILAQIEEQLEDITEEVSSTFGIQAKLDIFAKREPGGLEIGHPFVRDARAILAAMNIQPMLYPTSFMNALVAEGIPSITLGFTTGERRHDLDEIDETAAIGPMTAGLAQLVAAIISMDQELSNEAD